ncbi:MAG TPA: ABC transporter ATP-binding protein [Arsenicitalea sp.]|nr:ABC transporter ATP-binding protein [Arsenicitalea sp.]
MSEPLLKIRDLTVEFGPRGNPLRAVDHIDLEIPAKGCLGLVGESGSGKSMTSLAILRLIPEPPGRITSGSIEFDGVDLLKLPRDKMPDIRGREIAMIFQEPMSSLNPVMSIGNQIGEVLYLHEKLSRHERRERVLDALAQVGIPAPHERIDSYPNQFSGGMRQRVMIAMALACNPKLLIADEPTTALDVTVQAQVLDLIRKLRETRDMAVLLISHDLGVIAEVADVVAVMYAGKVIETGTVLELFDRPAHPYTRALLASIPRLDDERERLVQIKGNVPSAAMRHPGCKFAARCPLRQPVCIEKAPPMFDFGGTQKAACWVTSGALN